MKDCIRQIIESLVKNPARGVKAGTNMKITYRAGENLDRAMKYFDDFKSQQKKIQKLMHSAEMDSDGNLVITPRSTQGAKKIRSMMQDVLAPRKTNEDYLSEKIRDDIPANVQKIAKELGKAVALHSSQAKRLRDAGIPDDEKLPANVRKIPDELDKAVAAHKSQADRLRKADISETKNYDAGQPKPVRIRGLTGQRITQVMKNMTPAQKARLLKKLGPRVRKLTKGGAFVADRIMQQNESYKRGGHMSQIRKNRLRDKVRKNITAKRIEGKKRRQKNKSQGQMEN